MNTQRELGSNEPSTESKGRRRQGKEIKRQDWGYTEQYRRMMQRDNRKKTEFGEKE